MGPSCQNGLWGNRKANVTLREFHGLSLSVPAVIIGQRQPLYCQLKGRYYKATSSLFFVVCCLHSPLSGPALGEVGEAMRELSEVKDSLDMEVKQNFIDPLQNLHDKDLREIQVCAIRLPRSTQILLCSGGAYWVAQQRAPEFPAAPQDRKNQRPKASTCCHSCSSAAPPGHCIGSSGFNFQLK